MNTADENQVIEHRINVIHTSLLKSPKLTAYTVKMSSARGKYMHMRNAWKFYNSARHSARLT